MATHDLTAQGTLMDVLNQRGPDGNTMAIGEILTKTTPMMKDARWIEANDATKHKYLIRYSLPTSNKVEFNKGASSSLGSTKPMICNLKGIENRPSIDKRLIDIAPDGNAYLSGHLNAAIMGMGQDLETDIIYGSVAADDEYDGLAVRMNALTDVNVYDNGDTGSNLSSIYLVSWSPFEEMGAYLAYPKGTMAGIKHKDEGERNKDMADGSVLAVREFHLEVFAGLCIPDARYIGRIANIDTGTLSTSTFNENLAIQLLNELPAGGRESAVLYVSRKVKSAMEIRANDKANAHYTRENVFGEQVLMFMGVPVRLDEMISEAETQVV